MDKHIFGFRKSSTASKNSCYFEVPKVVLGVAAHPDDLDASAAGTVAAWAAKGAEVYYLILTNGDKGSADPEADPKELMRLRQAEQRAAAQVLGVKDVYFMAYEDGMLVCDMDVKRDVVRVIRQVRPQVVITMDPCMIYDIDRGFINHPDHRAAGQATLDAVYPLARDPLTFPELLAEGLEPHITDTVLLTNFSKHNCYVDITGTFETKIEALAAHASQMTDMQEVRRFMEDQAVAAGQESGVTYAEGFVRIEVHRS